MPQLILQLLLLDHSHHLIILPQQEVEVVDQRERMATLVVLVVEQVIYLLHILVDLEILHQYHHHKEIPEVQILPIREVEVVVPQDQELLVDHNLEEALVV
jgi:hypothetical protein